MSNEALYQINLKTPRGSLLNLRAWDDAQLDAILDGLTIRITRILQLEEIIEDEHKLMTNAAPAPTATQAIQNLQNAGLIANPPVVVAATPVAAPASAGTPTCDHGLPMRFVAAGISKAGKPYKAFYACPNARESACNKKVSA